MKPCRPTANGTPIGDHAAGDSNAKSKEKRKSGDRFALLNAFVDFTMKDLDRAEAFVWFALYRDTKADGLARTSQADLARRAGINARTARRAIASLKKKGLLKIAKQGGWQRGVSVYRVLPLERIPTIPTPRTQGDTGVRP